MKLPLSEIKPNPDNPRTIKSESFAKLVKSLKDFPEMAEVRELVLNKDHVILGGNMRYQAMVEAGWTEAPVKIVDWPEDKQKEFVIKDNVSGGEWDWDQLANEWDTKMLEEWGLELPDFAKDNEVEEDTPPEVSAEPAVSVLGGIYQLGRHKLMCGDSTKTEDVEKLMAGAIAHMVHTDPPYNVDYGSSKNPRHKIRSIENDSMDTDSWLNFCNDFMSNIRDFSKGDIYMWGASGPEGMRMRLWLVDMGAHWSATIIWKKQQLVLSPAKYQRIYEPCFYGWFDKSSFKADRKQVELWEVNRPMSSKEHPTMKPIELCAKAIRNSSDQDDSVLDLFGGSGSTLIACEQLDRTCFMMELDPKYCDVIRKRYWRFVNDNKEEGWQENTPVVNSSEQESNG